MARVKLTDEQIAEFKLQLVAVATRLFAKNGYTGVTMRAIAKELNCSPMKAYRYFGDKNEIFAMVRIAAYQAFGESQRNAYFSRDNVLERLSELGLAYYHYAAENPLQYRLMFELFQPDPEGYPELQQAETAAMEPLRTVIAEMVSRGTFHGNADVLTHVFWSGVHGVVSLNLAGKLGKRVDPKEVEKEVNDAIFRGLAST
jgi:AcrR family transcriptional regulator